MKSTRNLRAKLYASTGLVAAALLTAPAIANAAPVTVNTPTVVTTTLIADDALTITAAGEITSVPTGVAVTGVTAASIYNQGLIDVASATGSNIFGILIGGGGLTAGITNSGTIEAVTNGTDAAYGIFIDNSDVAGALTNSGSIEAQVSEGNTNAFAAAIVLQNTSTLGSLSNAATGSIEASVNSSQTGAVYTVSAYAISMDNSEITGALTNAGTISASAEVYGTTDNQAANAIAIRMLSGSSIGSFSNTATGKISASSDATVTVSDAIANATAISLNASEITGAFENAGEITATAEANNASTQNATMNAYAVSLVNGSVIESFSNTSTGTISSTITLDMNASNGTAGTAYGVNIDNSDVTKTIDNAGTISATAEIDMGTAQADATVYGIRLTNGSSAAALTNKAGGTISATVTGTSETDDISASAYGVYIDNSSLTGDLTNAGTISASVDVDSGDAITSGGSVSGIAAGIYLDNANIGGALINSGTVSASFEGEAWGDDFDAEVYGIRVSNGTSIDSITNTAAGKINATLDGFMTDSHTSNTVYGIYLNGSTVTGAVTNAGQINVSGTVDGEDSSIEVNAYGIYSDNNIGIDSLTNSSTGVINVTASSDAVSSSNEVAAYGIYSLSDTIAKALTNAGDIITSAYAGNETSSADAEAVGIYLNNTTVDGVVNSGDISATAEAVSTSDSATASAFGIRVFSGNVGEISNTGTITVDVSAEASTFAGAYSYGIFIENSNLGVVNSGTITATASGVSASSSSDFSAVGIFVHSGSDLTGGIENTGTITATSDDTGYGIWVDSSAISGGITNSGLISGSTYAIRMTALTGNSFITLEGDARIVGDVFDNNTVDGYSDVFVNTDFTTEGDFTVSDMIVGDGHSITISTGNTVSLYDMSASTGGTYAFGVTDDANFGTLVVTNGNLDFTDTKITAKVASGSDFEVGDEFMVADGVGTITGGPGATLTAIEDNSFLLNFSIADGTAATVATDDSDLFMFVTQAKTISEGAANTVYDEMAVVVEALEGSADTQFAAFVDNLYAASTEEEYNEVMESAAPTSDTGSQVAAVGMTGAMFDLADGQLSMVNTGSSGVSSGEELNGLHFWAQGFGGTSDQGERGGIDGYEADVYGFGIGVDTRNFNEATVLGLSFGYANTEVDSDNANRTKTDVDSYQFMLYGNHDLGNDNFVTGMAVYGWNDNDQTRHDVGGIAGLEADADYDSWAGGVRTSFGHNYHMENGFKLTPQVFAEYVHFSRDGFEETGAGGLNLTSDDADFNSLNLGLSGQAEWTIKTASGGELKPDIHASIKHDVLDDQADTTASFAAGGASFDVDGLDPADTTFGIGAGLKFYDTTGWDFTVNYDFTYKSDYDAHSGFIRAGYEF